MWFNGVLNGFQWCLEEVQWWFKGSFKGVIRIFQGSFKGVSRIIDWCSDKPLKKIQGRFKDKFKGCFMGFSKTF